MFLQEDLSGKHPNLGRQQLQTESLAAYLNRSFIK